MEFGLFGVAMAPFGLKTGASGPKSRSGPVFQNIGSDFGPILRQHIFVWTCSLDPSGHRPSPDASGPGPSADIMHLGLAGLLWAVAGTFEHWCAYI